MPVAAARAFAALLACVLALGAAPASAAAKLRVVTTMSTLGSLIAAVGGERVALTNLVPVGASPENYQPTPHDILQLRTAHVLVQNGAGLEGWLAHTISSAKNPAMRIVTCTEGLPVRGGNPHLWMDPEFARAYVHKIRDAFVAADPAGKADYDRNTAAYDVQLTALEQWIQAQIATIPAGQRNMIVFHDAWSYFNSRFGLRTIGVLEISPGQEPNPHAIGDLVALAKKYHVKAVFAEPEYSPKLIRALAVSAHITTVTNLYDDSLSADGSIHDYLGMLRYDTTTIVQALR